MTEDLTLNSSIYRRRCNLYVIISLIIIVLATIPFGFAGEKLIGFYKIYFIIYVSLMILWIVITCFLTRFIRKKEIEFFKNKYSLNYLNEFLSLKLEQEDYIFFDDVELKFTEKGLKNSLTNKTFEYNKFKINAYYICNYSGEMYKIFIDFENKKDVYTFKFDERLYIIIKQFNINVENLENVLTNCEINIKNFLKPRRIK